MEFLVAKEYHASGEQYTNIHMKKSNFSLNLTLWFMEKLSQRCKCRGIFVHKYRWVRTKCLRGCAHLSHLTLNVGLILISKRRLRERVIWFTSATCRGYFTALDPYLEEEIKSRESNNFTRLRAPFGTQLSICVLFNMGRSHRWFSDGQIISAIEFVAALGSSPI